ncbi:hypothetical protein, partial [Vibrio vulnificus]|uniref:hypothetical protein n=1 Tax=Vibrio vulnificus TaxID=672 RepID=UPI001C3DA419
AQTLKPRRFIRLTNALNFNEATLRIFSAHELESRKQQPPKASLPTRPKLEIRRNKEKMQPTDFT